MQIIHAHLLLENEIIKIAKRNKSRHAIIIAVFTGKKLPKYCTPMPRNPSPTINFPLNNNFSKIYFSFIRKNSSFRDGAILIQLHRDKLTLRGFSYRLYPPPLKVPRLKNMGSGYNSALDFSGVKRVICVYFINKNGIKKFIKGKEKELFKLKGNKIDKNAK
jgi:hypothetical protein